MVNKKLIRSLLEDSIAEAKRDVGIADAEVEAAKDTLREAEDRLENLQNELAELDDVSE